MTKSTAKKAKAKGWARSAFSKTDLNKLKKEQSTPEGR
jgi:hypothetical protein